MRPDGQHIYAALTLHHPRPSLLDQVRALLAVSVPYNVQAAVHAVGELESEFHS